MPSARERPGDVVALGRVISPSAVNASLDRAPRRLAISVVIASNRTRSLLDECLATVLPQCDGLEVEIVVARPAPLLDTDGRDPRGEVDSRVRYVAGPAGASIPVLRGLGLTAARGAVVALLEDHCVADAGWLRALIKEPARASLVGGSMANARRERLLEWGAYFSEYGFFSPTRPERVNGIPLLTGANIAYAREVVPQVAAWASDGEWENVIHDRLAGAGHTLLFVPDAIVYQNTVYSFREFCADRYRHGLAYARKRLAEEPATRRLLSRGLLLTLTPALPILQAWRVGRAVWASEPGAFLRALPLALAFFSAWSVGEAVGYLAGPAVPRAPGKPDSSGGESDTTRGNGHHA